jgi:hypothetical protein
LPPLVPQKHQPENGEYQRRSEREVREGHHRQEGVGLHDVDVQRMGQTTGQVLTDHQQPAQPGPQGDDQEGGLPVGRLLQEEGADKVGGQKESQTSNHTEDVEDDDVTEPQSRHLSQ